MWSASRLVAGTNQLQLEVPALKGHQHPAKIVPGRFASIDHEKWTMVPVRQVTVDPPAHDLVRHLELVPLLDEVFPGKRTPNSLDHSAQYRIDIFLRIPEDLEPIACRVPVLEFEGLQCNVLTGQMCVEVTPVRTAGEVRGSHGFEAGVLEVFQADPIGDLDIEAPGAEQALAVFQGSVVNCIVALGGFATNLKLNGVQFGCPFR